MAICLGAHATVSHVEVLGILLADRACGCRVGRGGTVTICSESQVYIRTISLLSSTRLTWSWHLDILVAGLSLQVVKKTMNYWVHQ